MKEHRSQGSGWVAAQFALMAVQLLSVAVKRKQWPSPASSAAGAALVAAAAAYGLPGVRSLGRNRTPLPEPKADGQLVTTGIYAHVRHPLYAAVMAAGFGWALLWRSWPALILAAVQAAFLREKANNEEKRLRARFPDYTTYARRVPRFLPHLTSQSEPTENL
jgi:protein-S-isoprenylcysteine O-methyltransferase Ste14